MALLPNGWSRLLLGLSLLLVAAACSSTPGNIGIGLPSVDAGTGAFLVDTLTIKTSTVLRDSVVTSTSGGIIVGRYTDKQLGVITAKGYTTLGLGGYFTPERTQQFDSVVLVLTPTYKPTSNSPNFRYGDTTKVQTLVNVRPLKSFIPTTQYGFASPKLTPMTNNVDNSRILLANTAKARLRARTNLATIRLPLSNDFGSELMKAGQDGFLLSQEQLDSRFPGLALLPDDADDAALVGFDVTSTTTGVILYYHDPADISTALSHTFPLNGGRHFYQVEADRQQTSLAALRNVSLSQLPASSTGEQTYIEGALGLQTKLEIPYLFNLRQFGQHFVMTSATLTAEIPATTIGTNLTPPATLTAYTTDQRNHQGSLLPTDAAGTTTTIGYNSVVSNTDGITQAGYSWSVINYCQAVLNGNIPNNGMLLNTTNVALPERVVLGSPNRTTNKLRLRLYLISNGD